MNNKKWIICDGRVMIIWRGGDRMRWIVICYIRGETFPWTTGSAYNQAKQRHHVLTDLTQSFLCAGGCHSVPKDREYERWAMISSYQYKIENKINCNCLGPFCRRLNQIKCRKNARTKSNKDKETKQTKQNLIYSLSHILSINTLI